jgi:non-ribosomal peptide synthetase component F
LKPKALSYRQLNERSNQLAHYLQRHGVKKEALVPVCIERSLEMIIGILGILKAGAAYVPIDPAYPPERISFMLEDTGAKTIVTSHTNRSKLQVMKDIDLIELDNDWAVISKELTSNPPAKSDPHQLAYVIYTSGSTGRPKGVLIEHIGVVSLVKGIDYVSLGEDDILLSTGSSSFDATTFEYWGMLA